MLRYSGRSIVYYRFTLKCPVYDDGSFFNIKVRLLAYGNLRLLQNSGMTFFTDKNLIIPRFMSSIDSLQTSGSVLF